MTDHVVDLSPDEQVEIDVWAVIDGRILLGEAKDNDELARSNPDRLKKARRLRAVSDAFTADEFVFATTRARWKPSTQQAVAEAFAGARTAVRWLHDVDQDWQSAPG